MADLDHGWAGGWGLLYRYHQGTWTRWEDHIFDETALVMDIESITWLDQEVAGMNPRHALPKMLWSCEVAGTVTAQAARQSGLAAGTPVIAGSIDAAAEAVSAGVSQLGDMMMMFGVESSNCDFHEENVWQLD